MDFIYGLVMGAGAVTGMWIASRPSKGPLCACGHHYSFHAGKDCNASGCYCRMYVGPILDASGKPVPEDKQ